MAILSSAVSYHPAVKAPVVSDGQAHDQPALDPSGTNRFQKQKSPPSRSRAGQEGGRCYLLIR